MTATDDRTAVEPFAGPGGWDEGVRPLGIRPRGIEWDPAACETGRAAGHERVQADVAELEPMAFGRASGEIASPPCPGFSVAGNGRGRVDIRFLLAALEVVRTRADLEREMATLQEVMTDSRSLLALEPLRYALALTPSWLAWEQVPAVLPLWEACAVVLRRLGYTVDTAVLNAEQYGVPQTRRRAILVARAPWLTAELGPARLPVPTHSRYYPRDPQRLDPGVLPWVSMAEALGWGMTARPAMTVTGGGTGSGGPEPFGNGARRGIIRERDAGRWLVRDSFGKPAEDYAGRSASRWKDAARRPAPAVTSKARNWAVQTPGAESIRLTVEDAAALQTFPAGYPWQGSRTAQFRQIGDAMPPLLAQHVVAAVTGAALPLPAETLETVA